MSKFDDYLKKYGVTPESGVSQSSAGSKPSTQEPAQSSTRNSFTDYLGKYGAVDQGRVRLKESDWDAFLAAAEDLQLEYFPEAERSDAHFECKLSYSDEIYKKIELNQDTEEALKAFFFTLINP